MSTGSQGSGAGGATGGLGSFEVGVEGEEDDSGDEGPPPPMDDVRRQIHKALLSTPAGYPIPPSTYKHAYWRSELKPGERVIMAGLVRKKRGFFSRVLRREIVLTDTPRLAYFVPKEKSFKANIPWEGKGMEAYVLEEGNPVEWRIVARSGMYALWCEQGMATRWVDSIIAMRDGIPPEVAARAERAAAASGSPAASGGAGDSDGLSSDAQSAGATDGAATAGQQQKEGFQVDDGAEEP